MVVIYDAGKSFYVHEYMALQSVTRWCKTLTPTVATEMGKVLPNSSVGSYTLLIVGILQSAW